MRGFTSQHELLQPRTLNDALAMMRDHRGVIPLAGGTDLMVAMHAGQKVGKRFLNLWGLKPLRRIDVKGKTLSIGALTTYTDLVKSIEVGARVPMLIDASRVIGGAQIQNRGTLAGNIANGSPAGDTLPVLAALDATVVVRNVDGVRRIPFNHFYTGYRKNRMKRDELIVAIEIPPVEGAQWFRKVGTRAAQAISKVVMAGVRGDRVTLAAGSVAPTVIRLSNTEAVLNDGEPIDDAIAAARAEISPIDDVRSTASYRRVVVGNLVRRFWIDTHTATSLTR